MWHIQREPNIPRSFTPQNMRGMAKYLATGDDVPQVASGDPSGDDENENETGPADPGTDPWTNQQVQPVGVDEETGDPNGTLAYIEPDDSQWQSPVLPVSPAAMSTETAQQPPVTSLLQGMENVRQAYANAPIPKPAKWWEKGLSGAVGGLAGWSNAASRMKQPINAAPAEENILHPGFSNQAAEYQARVISPAEKQVQLIGEQVGAQYGSTKAQSEAQLKAAQAQMNIDRAKYYSNLASQNRTAPVPVTPELAELSGNVYHEGQTIPAGNAAELTRIAAGRYDPKYQALSPADKYNELMKIPGMTPEMARMGAINPTEVGKPPKAATEAEVKDNQIRADYASALGKDPATVTDAEMNAARRMFGTGDPLITSGLRAFIAQKHRIPNPAEEQRIVSGAVAQRANAKIVPGSEPGVTPPPLSGPGIGATKMVDINGIQVPYKFDGTAWRKQAQ